LAIFVWNAYTVSLFFGFSRLLRFRQQQQEKLWRKKATIVSPLAVHMNPSISFPTSAPMFSSVTLVAAMVMMVKIAVAMILAKTVQRQARTVPTEAMKMAAPRRQNGISSATTKHSIMPVKNRPNIT